MIRTTKEQQLQYWAINSAKQARKIKHKSGVGWYKAPEKSGWQKSCLTEGGEIVEQSKEDTELELLQNAKFSTLFGLNVYLVSILVSTQQLW
jgi:hypothetical protein